MEGQSPQKTPPKKRSIWRPCEPHRRKWFGQWHEFRVHIPRGCLHPHLRLGHLGTMEFGSSVQILMSFIHGIFGNHQKRSNIWICWKWFSSLWKPMDFWAPQFWNKPKLWCSQSNCVLFSSSKFTKYEIWVPDFCLLSLQHVELIHTLFKKSTSGFTKKKRRNQINISHPSYKIFSSIPRWFNPWPFDP